MNLFSFFSTKETNKIKLILFLDAGKGNARGAVVEIRKGVPHILYTVSGEQKIGTLLNKQALPLALSSLEQVLMDIAKALRSSSLGKKRYVAEEVCCIIAEPYYLSHTSIITHQEKKPFTISQNLVKNLITSHRTLLPEAHKEILLGSSPYTVQEHIIEIKINGYHNDNPYGKVAEGVELSIFKTQIDKNLIEAISRIIRNITPAPIVIEPLSLAAFIAIRNRVDSKSNFLFVTVGSDVSEVSLIKDHALLETVSFPFGKHSLSRLIAGKMKTTPEDALFRLGLYHDKKMSKEEEKSFVPVVEETQGLWFSYLEKALVNLSEEVAIPENIYIFVDTDIKDMFGPAIIKMGFASQTLVPHGFSIHTLDAASLADSCTFGLDIRFDAILAISASFANANKQVLEDVYN